jgi:hypothetical protein
MSVDSYSELVCLAFDSVPSLPNQLSGFYKLANRRTAVMPKLLGLAGRLELLLSQISKYSGEAAALTRANVRTRSEVYPCGCRVSDWGSRSTSHGV